MTWVSITRDQTTCAGLQTSDSPPWVTMRIILAVGRRRLLMDQTTILVAVNNLWIITTRRLREAPKWSGRAREKHETSIACSGVKMASINQLKKQVQAIKETRHRWWLSRSRTAKLTYRNPQLTITTPGKPQWELYLQHRTANHSLRISLCSVEVN